MLYSFGQETTSQMLGSVTQNGTGLAGATVIALHVPTGTKYTTTTRKDGRYNLDGLRVGGPYVLTVSYVGFKEQKTEGINLTLGQDYTGDFSMVSDTKVLEVATVSAGRQNKIFNSNHTGGQELISHDQILKLPTINRSIQDFTRLEPTSNGSSFGGRSAQMNNITVDGANFNNGFGLSATLGGQTGSQPIALDAIDQIQVNVSPYDVRQGSFTGAGINAITKSGTNTFQGSVYTYLKGPGTQGYLVETNKVPRSVFKYYTRGAYLGGAFIPDRLFFFVSYEEVNQTVPALTQVAATPSQPANGSTVSQATASQLDSLKSFLISKYSLNPGSYQGYSYVTNSKKVTAKIDYNINSDNVLTLKYNRLRSYAQEPQSTSRTGSNFGHGPAYYNYVYGLPYSGSGYSINNNVDIVIAELNTRFGNKWSNKFQAGYTRERDPRSPGTSNPFPFVDILNGNGNTYGSQILTSFGYETYTYGNYINTDVYQLSDIAVHYAGAHEITIGTQDYSRKYTDAFAPNFAGGYQFPSLQAFYNAANGVGAPVDRYFQEWSNIPGGPFPQYSAGSTEIGVFAQDKWRVVPNFTLIYGIRFDETIYKQIYLDNPYFDALTFANGKSYNIGKAPGNSLLFAPRVGFNWDVKHDRSLQIRGGAGIFEGPPPFVWLENQAANNGVQLGSFTEKNVPFFQTAQGGLNNYLTTTGQTQTSTPLGYSVDVASHNFKYPSKLRTSLGIDKKLPDNWIITGEFTYSKDIQATYMYNANLNETNGFALNNGGDNRERFISPTNANSNKYYYAGTSLQNPNLGNVIVLANSHKGYSYSAVAKIQKNWHNLTVSVAYAYSQVKSVMETGSTASTLWASRAVANTDPNAATLAHPSWYQPNRVIAYGNYKIPEGKFLATTIGFVFEAAPNGVTSYVYNGDLNGDGNTSNDLIYIPKSATDINLVDVSSVGTKTNQTTNGVTTGTPTDPRTAAQIWTQLNNFINQDHYLYKHRGQYAQANSVVEPWFKHLDMHVNQDFYLTTHNGTKHTLSLSFDLINVGNFLNRNWGLAKTVSTASFLKFEGMAADGKTPLMSFPYSDATNQVPYTNSFSYSTSTFSRWQMQLGARYVFN